MKSHFNTRQLRLETLEERALLAVTAGGFGYAADLPAPTEATTWVVNTTADPTSWSDTDAIVSLREALARASDGDTINFDASLSGGTITLGGSQLSVGKAVTVDASGIGGITINADGRSRAFYVTGGSEANPVELIGLTVTGGNADLGGGIYNNGGALVITNSTISGNSASESGGGIYSEGTGTDYAALTVTGSVIFGNTGYGKGGGICGVFSTLTITGSTIAGNVVDYNILGLGGGVYSNGSAETVTITNSIIACNSATFDYDIRSSYSGSNNLFGLNPGFVVRPSFRGGTLANADEVDLTLSETSAAIDRGLNDAVETETDAAGNVRIFAAWKGTPTVDIGAYEYQRTVERGEIETPSTVVTTPLDSLDETDGQISLREAILYAAPGDRIVFSQTFSQGLDEKSVAVYAGPLKIEKSLTIDASSVGGISIVGTKNSGVFDIGSTPDVEVELIGLTIRDGKAAYGGGICNSATLKITGLTLSGNYASTGGAVFNTGAMTITNSAFTGNNAEGGAGIANSGTMTVSGSTISNNTSKLSAGGISNTGIMTLSDSIVSGNTAVYDFRCKGGGICNEPADSSKPGVMTIIHSTITGNSTSGKGGGIYNAPGAPYWWVNPGRLTIIDSTITENSAPAAGRGGGIYNHDNGTLIISNSTIESNSKENIRGPWSEYAETPSTVVTTLRDVVDSTDDLISLREAISYAADGETVTFDDALGGGTITLGGSALEITGSVGIYDASFGGITIDAGGLSRVLIVSGGSPDAPVTLTGLNLVNGSADNGGGIYISGGALKLTTCRVSGNAASSSGGGIYGAGALTLVNTAVYGNAAASGGGVYTDAAASLANCTVSGNAASASGGGIYVGGGTLSLTNTIVSLNDADVSVNIAGAYTGSHNIVDSDPGFVFPPIFENGVLVNADELSLALDDGSPAINAGTNAAVETETDLDGNPRIDNGIVDIGAFEYIGGFTPTPLDAPAILTGSRGIYVSYGANRHYIQWGAVAGASGYEVQYSTGGANWTSVSAAGTSAVITGLSYGADVTYRVRALGSGSYLDSGWSRTKTFNVCPMDVNNDGDISNGDRTIVANAWLSEEGDDDYRYYADINGDGEVTNPDRPFIGQNWNKEAGDADLLYPRALHAADAVFAEYDSAEIGAGTDLF
ncbi:MAG: hypothetical protein IK105_08580 [Thermoguttaceae bacterium]|nr:hypothetical protein [Thermoguttaceae bacterium]